MNNLKRLVRVSVGVVFIGIGIHHFLVPDPYVLIVPAYLPSPSLLVFVSGAFEVIGGAGLLMRATRKVAAWGLITLLVAVYPANINMLVNEIYLPGMPKAKWLLWFRMPLQFLLGWLVFWVGDLKRLGRSASSDS